jgi:hypothetical protein
MVQMTFSTLYNQAVCLGSGKNTNNTTAFQNLFLLLTFEFPFFVFRDTPAWAICFLFQSEPGPKQWLVLACHCGSLALDRWSFPAFTMRLLGC